MSNERLDFDSSDALKLQEAAYKMASDAQEVRNYQYNRNHKLYHGYIDAVDRNPDRANIHIPKIYNIIETKLPRYIQAAHATRPYIPFEAVREEFQSYATQQEKMLDDLLYRGQFLQKRIMAVKLGLMHGTSFMEPIPVFEKVREKQQYIDDWGMPQVIENEVERLRLKLKVFAPWEVYVDPYATGLESPDDCRFVVKVELVSRREIIKMAEAGNYPGLDIDKLREAGQSSSERSGHWGLQMLSELGLSIPESDDDMGVLIRYESPDRYIDSWDGMVVLRDTPNLYSHGRINLARLCHGLDPHTQNSFWGMGEIKPAEILQAMLNDLWNMSFDNHFMLNQNIIYYRTGVVDPETLIRTPGNRIGLNVTNDKSIRDSIIDDPGQSLPRDHYMMPDVVERQMDITSGGFKPITGETSEKKTASEAAMLKEAGETRLGLSIRQDEVFLASFGSLCLSHIDQFATTDDKVEILGEEGASMLYTANPADLPGGFNFQFKGADRVANLLMKQRNVKEVAPILLQIPNVSQAWIAEYIMRTFEVPDSEIEQAVIPDQIMMMLQQQQMMQQQQMEMDKSNQRHGQDMEKMQIQSQYKAHTPEEEARDSAIYNNPNGGMSQ